MSGLSRSQTFKSVASSPSSTSAPTLNDEGSGPSSHTASTNQDQTWDGSPIRGVIRRSHRPRNPGGFLLGLPDGSTDVRFSDGSGAQNLKTSKGKERRRDAEGPSEAIHARHAVPPPKLSVRGSPLAHKVNSDELHEQSVASGQFVGGLVDTDGHHSQAAQYALPSFNTSPAQLVNLALNLSESRRRQSSYGRLASYDPTGTRRLVSATQSPTLGGNHVQSSSRQHRRTSRSLAPATTGDGLATAFPISGVHENEGNTQASPTPMDGHASASVFHFDPSPATLARAEKARTALGLRYEYRRLLQYLPKLPVSTESRPNTASSVARRQISPQETLGRAYNPLQYIRNRKVRIRERRAINSEADGWKNVDDVRNWVTDVTAQRKDRISSVDDQYPLPPFLRTEAAGSTDLEGASSASVQRHNEKGVAKVVRPRMDWTFTPWAMLADAYWLDQEDNRNLIEDRDGNKLFMDSKSSYHHRRTTAGRKLTRASTQESGDITRSSTTSQSSLMIDDVLLAGSSMKSAERGPNPFKKLGSVISLDEDGSSGDWKKRWPYNLMRSRSPSSSEASGRSSLSSMLPRLSSERQETSVVKNRIIDLPSHDVDDYTGSRNEHTNDSGYARARYLRHASSNQNNVDVGDSTHSEQADPAYRGSKAIDPDHVRGRGLPPWLSTSDFDSTAPSSPIDWNFVPSIAINLSPPRTPLRLRPKPSPSPRRTLRARRHKEDHKVAETDFAFNRSAGGALSIFQNSRDAHTQVIDNSSADFLSPQSAKGSGSLRRKPADHSLNKGENPTKIDTKSRGLDKGGRLVDRVGSFIKCRDGNSSGSTYDSEVSETDEDQLAKNLETPLTNHTSSLGALSRQSLKYRRPDLPVFKSPFQGNDYRNSRDTTGDITRQQHAILDTARSSRFDRLVPPGLDMRSITPSPSPSLKEIETNDTNATDSESQRADSGNFMHDRRGAIVPGSTGRPYPVTGLSGFSAHRRARKESADHAAKHNPKESNTSTVATKELVTPKDIVRARALLLSTGVKASGIVSRAYQVPDSPHPILRDLQSKHNLPTVPRCREMALIARILVEDLDENNAALRKAANHLSNETVDKFHRELLDMEECIFSKLTSHVRDSADAAEELGAQLATSCRLDIKRLNDRIDLIIHRRKRRFRWIRKGAYLLLEWTLVALMWWVWLIVVVVRMTRVFLKGTYRSVRWVLWL